MTTMTRTDIHSPTNMDPANYEFIECFDNQTWEVLGHSAEYAEKIYNDDLLGRGVHQCHHCGAHLRYFAIMLHIPTNTYVIVGETCLDERFSLATKAQFDRLRKQSAALRAQQRIKTAAAEWLDAQTDELAREVFARDADLSRFNLNDFQARKVNDYRNKLWNQYGNIFDSGRDYALKLVREAIERTENPRPVERKVDAPEGNRLTVVGEVVSAKWKESDYGDVLKLTLKVQKDNGIWLLWVSCPSSLNADRGDIVQMCVNVTRSDRDPFFAFGKRPTKALMVKEWSEGERPSSLD